MAQDKTTLSPSSSINKKNSVVTNKSKNDSPIQNLDKNFRRPRRVSGAASNAKSTVDCGLGRNAYRTIDGTCNNISDDTRCEWGATDIQLRRTLPAQYGASDPNNALAEEGLSNPRAISNAIASQSNPMDNHYNHSAWVFTWGQFLDHDITLTPEGETEEVPILLPDDEPLFTMPLSFKRSEVHEGTGENNVRQQTNMITAWVDASNVYGSDPETAEWLRTHTNGKLKTSEGDLLPYNTTNGEADPTKIDPSAPSMAGDDRLPLHFVAGDARANEQPGLTTLHTLFVREHNRLCDEFLAQGLSNDETIYQEARKRVGAIIQSITYQEFLPALGLHLSPYKGYDPTVQPDITNLFATAAYRLGHTMVTKQMPLYDENCQSVGSGSLSLIESFFNPTHIQNMGLEPFIAGLCQQVQQEMDALIIDELRNFLFAPPGTPNAPGLDLAALNIQRGRDHGLPDYKTVRAFFTGTTITTFADISANVELQNGLASVYSDLNNIDLWIGLLGEDHLSGTSLGATLYAILKQQFEQIRDGDFYFYENDLAIAAPEIAIIKRTRLSDIIRRNSHVKNLQADVFYMEECIPSEEGLFLQVLEKQTVNPCELNDVTADLCNGKITIRGIGNCIAEEEAIYTFHWRKNEDTNNNWQLATNDTAEDHSVLTIENLCEGNYSFRVTDACGSEFIKEITLSPKPALKATILQQKAVTCAQNGSIKLKVKGGKAPYEYAISSSNTPLTDFQYSHLFSDLEIGDYTLWIKDAAGCTTQITATMTSKAPLEASIFKIQKAICESPTGMFAVMPAGGTAPFRFSIDGGENWQKFGRFDGLFPDNYTVFVEDASGCNTRIHTSIGQKECHEDTSLVASVEEVIDITLDPINHIIKLTVHVNETKQLKVSILDISERWNFVRLRQKMVNNQYTHNFNMKKLPKGMYYVKVNLDDDLYIKKILIN